MRIICDDSLWITTYLGKMCPVEQLLEYISESEAGTLTENIKKEVNKVQVKTTSNKNKTKLSKSIYSQIKMDQLKQIGAVHTNGAPWCVRSPNVIKFEIKYN